MAKVWLVSGVGSTVLVMVVVVVVVDGTWGGTVILAGGFVRRGLPV